MSLAIWVTMLSVPLGGLLTDRLGRPTLLIVTGSLVAAATTLLIPVLAPPCSPSAWSGWPSAPRPAG